MYFRNKMRTFVPVLDYKISKNYIKKAMPKEQNVTEIEQICRWNDKSMELLYDHYYRALVSYGCQFVDKEIAEDIVQELFSVLWEQRPQFKGHSHLTSYLYTTVRNASYNHLRHQNVHNNYRQGILEHLQEFMFADDVAESFNKEEIYRQLFAAIDQLPPRQREVFLLCMDGKKNKEIAEQLQISAETVKVQKRRAINNLRQKLTPATMALLYMKLVVSTGSLKS